ncbi:MAG: thioredoxin domain-containing protein [Bacteroidota bacterium]
MTPQHTNRLADEKSPYLLQHAHNPVDWWPWTDAAFEEARRRDVPVFLSIGYATCHWCHVMEEQSFEDAEAASALNRAFVCVKVDREERPDVDGIYMSACLALNGQGGWPLTALLVPETREPFYVATYLPKHSRGGRIGVLDLAERVSKFWREDRASVSASADKVGGLVQKILAESEPGEAITTADLQRASDLYARSFDVAHGGFGSQPKFPSPHGLLFLLRHARHTGDGRARDMAVRTLRAIARGGITDHTGGGVHRYSTDRRWLLPHFEKMLYDQAGLAMAWTEAWQSTGDMELREAAERTLDYVVRELQQEHGGIASAEDADSLDAHGRREEGAFYVWTEAELVAVLGSEWRAFARVAFGTMPQGNFLDEATRQRTGGNVLHLPDDPAALAKTLDLDLATFHQQRADLLRTLFEARASRPRPLLDDKILADWNGLAIAALAISARVFSREDYAEAAVRAAEFVLQQLRHPDGRLLHRWRDGDAAIPGFLDDYAFLAWGLIELHAATQDVRYLRLALDLHHQTRDHFEDSEGGYFLTEAGSPGLLVRQRALDDGALPSGNAVAAMNGVRLGALTGDPDLTEPASRALAADARVRAHPTGHAAHMLAAQLLTGPLPEIVTAPGEGMAAMEKALQAVYAPGSLRLWASDALSEIAPFTAGQVARDGRATAYICRGGACQAPTTDPTEAARTLASMYD